MAPPTTISHHLPPYKPTFRRPYTEAFLHSFCGAVLHITAHRSTAAAAAVNCRVIVISTCIFNPNFEDLHQLIDDASNNNLVWQCCTRECGIQFQWTVKWFNYYNLFSLSDVPPLELVHTCSSISITVGSKKIERMKVAIVVNVIVGGLYILSSQFIGVEAVVSSICVALAGRIITAASIRVLCIEMETLLHTSIQTTTISPSTCFCAS